MKKVLPLSKGSKVWVWLTALMQVFKGCVYIFQVYVMAWFVVGFYDKSLNSDSLVKFLLAFAGVMLAKGILSYFESFFSYRISSGIKIDFRSRIFNKILDLGLAYTENNGTAEIIANSIDGVEAMEVFYGRFVPQLISSLIIPIILFVMAVRINLICAIILLAAVPIIPMSMMFISKWAKKSMGSFWGDYESLSTTFLENLQGMVTLKLFNKSSKKLQDMEDKAWTFRKSTMELLRMQLTSVTVMDTLVYGFAGIGIFLSVFFFYKGKIDLFGVTVLIFLSVEFFLPIRKLGSYFHAGVNGIQAGKKISKFLSLKARTENCGSSSLPKGFGLKLNDVSFAYGDDGENILSSTSLDLEEGGIYGIAGASGCGKSTIASLIMRFYDVNDGAIEIGGMNIKDFSLVDLRKKVTLVSSNSTMFTGTIRDNLLLANPDADDKTLMEVCKISGFVDSVDNFAILDKSVGEKGKMLSGGERQRLAVARALLFNSDLLILDEATGSVDLESERIIKDTVYNLKGKKTVLIISHRPKILEGADRIFTIKDKKIVEISSASSVEVE